MKVSRVYQLMQQGATTMTHPQEDIWIPAQGERLRASLHWPGEAPAPCPAVIGVHGLLSNRQSRKQIDLARGCTERGMAYLRFDHRGCGESSGNLEQDTSLANRVADLRAVYTYLQENQRLDPDRIGLFGSSFGGTVCLAFFPDQPVSAVVTLAAPIRSRPLMALAPEQIPRAIPASFYAQRQRFDLAERIAKVHHLLCCHGDADEIVPPAHAREIETLAQRPKKLLILETGDHRLSNPAHRELLITRAQAWFSRYLIGK